MITAQQARDMLLPASHYINDIEKEIKSVAKGTTNLTYYFSPNLPIDIKEEVITILKQKGFRVVTLTEGIISIFW